MSDWRLLVIEDEQKIAELVCRVAKEVGFNTWSASGYDLVENAYDNFQPHVIVLDILMPEMDGMEVLQYLRDQFSNARIVILSGSEGLSHRLTENMGKALGLTMAADIYKPFRVAELRKLFAEIKASLSSAQDTFPTEGAA